MIEHKFYEELETEDIKRPFPETIFFMQNIRITVAFSAKPEGPDCKHSNSCSKLLSYLNIILIMGKKDI